MPGNPLSLVTTGNGVVKNDITVMVAGWTLTSLREHRYTHSVLVRDHKLSRSDMETKCTLRKYRMDKKAYRFYSSFILVKQYAIYEQLQMVT